MHHVRSHKLGRTYIAETGFDITRPGDPGQTVLGADLTHFPVVIAPCNPRGYKMFPDREACEQLFRSDPGRFFADELTAGGSVPVETALAHVQELGLAGAVLDVRAVETAYREGGLGVGAATGAV